MTTLNSKDQNLQIFSRSEHPIVKEMIDDDALFVLRRLNKAGFTAYLVGGGVRDLYMGKTPKDFDISTEARPGQIRKLFPNSRTIGRRFRLVQVFFSHGKIVEVSTLRSLSEHDLDGPEAVLAPNNTYGTLDEDAQRRDLSINALFYEIEEETIIDYVGGVSDLDGATIRIIGAPEKRINRDPVRMMRVIRHSARTNFTIEENSWDAVCRHSAKLSLCPSSRLRDEVLKDIYCGVSLRWFELAVRSGLFVEIFPIYRDFLSSSLPDGSLCRERLETIFRTIDRINNEAVNSGLHRQPDYFLLSFILVPWAVSSFDLFNLNLKKGGLFHFSKKLRKHINETIGLQLNLKKSTRQEITTLLAHLPLISLHMSNGQLPKWLKRKSYYKKCRLLYFCLREATENIEAPAMTASPDPGDAACTKKKSSRSGRSKRKGRPAFSSINKGGVFGFKK